MKKILFAFPPGDLTDSNNQSFPYPIISAMCATMLEKYGNQVAWFDAPAEGLGEVDFAKYIANTRPEFIIFKIDEKSKNGYYEVINGIKLHIPDIKIILCEQKEETKTCEADFIIHGKDWYFEAFKIVMGIPWDMKAPMPHINRVLTKWWLYAYRNANFRYLPGTNIISVIDCLESQKSYLREVDDVVTEIERLTEAGFKEIFDDSISFPAGEWLQRFCEEMIKRDLPRYVSLGCNMRHEVLQENDFKLMAKAGFRLIVWDSLDPNLKYAKSAGIESRLKSCHHKYKYLVMQLLIEGMLDSADGQGVILNPIYLFRKLKKIKSWNDFKYYTRGTRRLFDRFGQVRTYDRPSK